MGMVKDGRVVFANDADRARLVKERAPCSLAAGAEARARAPPRPHELRLRGPSQSSRRCPSAAP